MRRMLMLSLVILPGMALVAVGAPEDVAGKEAETTEVVKEPTAAELAQRLLTLAADGKLTDQLITLFNQYTLANAKEKLAEVVPADFWIWLSERENLREGLLAALHPHYSPHVVKRLQELREKFGDKLDTYPHLALAFAVTFGQAGESPPWSGSERARLGEHRKAPTMLESFAYYLKYEKAMRSSLRNMPWMMLAYVADNETPLNERLWALKTYARTSKSRMRSIYYDPPYTLNARARYGNRVRTLDVYKKFGGHCGDRAYYSSRVYKSFGIPAISDSGEGKRGAHAWVAWIYPVGKGLDMRFSGRFSYDKYYTGTTYCPLERKQVLDRDIQLTAIGLGWSYKKYMDARVGSHIYEMFEGDDRKGKTGLLKDAVDRNRFTAQPWRLLAAARVEGIISEAEGQEVFDSIFKALSALPDLTYEVLAKVLLPRLQGAGDPEKSEIEKNLRVLSRAYGVYEKAKRPDLAVKLCLMQGGYLEALDRSNSALRLYVLTSEKYAKEHFGFRDAFDRALRLLDGDRNVKKRLAFCHIMIKEVPPTIRDVNRRITNPSWVYVVRAYIRALYAAGKDNEAERWEAKLERGRDDD